MNRTQSKKLPASKNGRLVNRRKFLGRTTLGLAAYAVSPFIAVPARA